MDPIRRVAERRFPYPGVNPLRRFVVEETPTTTATAEAVR